MEVEMIQQEKIVSKSILASIAITFCTYAYLLSISSLIGSLILSAAFIASSVYNLNLFTDRVNSLSDSSDFRRLLLILLINIFTAYIFGIAFTFANNSITIAANSIVTNRLNTDILTIIISSTVTGFLCSLSFELENRLKLSNLKPSYIIVILCTLAIVFANLPHCIIDMFIYSASSVTFENFYSVAIRLLLTTLFNFLGCSLFNVIANKSFMYSRID